MSARRLRSVFHEIVLLVLSTTCLSQVPATIADQFSTSERIQRSAWWPTDGRSPRSAYAGAKACSGCHYQIFKTQTQHAMAQTSRPAEQSQILQDHAGQTFSVDGYEYKIIRSANGEISYTVNDPTRSFSAPIEWAFGAGKVGQSYLYKQGANYHEIRFSYFETLHAFGVTPNQSIQAATSIDKASGRLVPAGEARRCFGCHTSASTTSDHFEPQNAVPGVSCESCHGPGEKHVKAMQAGELDTGRGAIVNPGRLKPVDLVDFCGACHTTWWDARRISATGIANVRFHPYRLESSRCWGNGDVRLTCPACHNPHQPLVREARAYDGKCLACHVSSGSEKITAGHPGKACPVSKQDCITCHMPKYEVPDMHYKYTDHRIRVAKAGETFPD